MLSGAACVGTRCWVVSASANGNGSETASASRRESDAIETRTWSASCSILSLCPGPRGRRHLLGYGSGSAPGRAIVTVRARARVNVTARARAGLLVWTARGRGRLWARGSGRVGRASYARRCHRCACVASKLTGRGARCQLPSRTWRAGGGCVAEHMQWWWWWWLRREQRRNCLARDDLWQRGGRRAGRGPVPCPLLPGPCSLTPVVAGNYSAYTVRSSALRVPPPSAL